MPIENVYIARVTDGLILVSSMDHGSQGSGNSDKMELYKNQAKQMLKPMLLNHSDQALRLQKK